MALQEASEAFAIERLSDAARVANHQKRKAPTDVDMRLVRDLKPMNWEKKRERDDEDGEDGKYNK